MQYICDRMEPRVPCELVRGYLDFSPHAWNVVIVKEGESLVRMIVDSCHPLDIREESDPEYFCRLAFVSVYKDMCFYFKCAVSCTMNSSIYDFPIREVWFHSGFMFHKRSLALGCIIP